MKIVRQNEKFILEMLKNWLSIFQKRINGAGGGGGNYSSPENTYRILFILLFTWYCLLSTIYLVLFIFN